MLIRRICSAQRNQVIGDIELSTHTAIVRYRGICELQSGISAQPMIRFFIKSSFVGNPLILAADSFVISIPGI